MHVYADELRNTVSYMHAYMYFTFLRKNNINKAIISFIFNYYAIKITEITFFLEKKNNFLKKKKTVF